jgi:hypothetical protein
MTRPPRIISLRSVTTSIVELAGLGLAGWSLYLIDVRVLGVVVGLGLVAVGYMTSKI